MNWTYNAKQYDPSKVGGYELIPEGDHRCRVKTATEGQTKKEPIRDMIVLELEISGYTRSLKYYIVLDGTSEEATARTNQTLGTVFASFAIPAGNLNLAAWTGKVGAVHVSNEEYTGSDGKEHMGARAAWLLLPDQAKELPPWGRKAVASTPAPAQAQQATPPAYSPDQFADADAVIAQNALENGIPLSYGDGAPIGTPPPFDDQQEVPW